MEPARQLTQVLDRRLELLAGAPGDRREHLVVREPLLDGAHPEQRDHEPLLGAVVQVPLEPPSLGLTRLHQPLPRGVELVDLRVQVAVEPVTLHRDPHHGHEDREELRPLEQPRVVRDQPDLAALVLDRGDRPPGPLDRHGRAQHVDVAQALPVPPEDLEPLVLEDQP